MLPPHVDDNASTVLALDDTTDLAIITQLCLATVDEREP